MNIDHFNTKIRQVWAGHFQRSVDDLNRDGTNIILNEDQKDSNRIDIWIIEQHSFLRIDPNLQERVEQFVSDRANTTAIQVADFVSAWGDTEALHQNTTDICYLYPDWFTPVAVQPSFSCRQMQMVDKPYLDKLHSICTKDDLEESDIEIDNDMVFGCFQEQTLVSVASMYKVWGGFADIGVLTHPEYRGQGLGKVAVSALTKRLLEDDQIALYRYGIDNLGSGAIARALGFRKYYEQQSVKIK